MKKLSFLLITLFLINSCGAVKEAGKVMRNEKIQTTDEFLVKKRDPLVLPPNYEEMTQPRSSNKKNENEGEKIKKILKAPQTESISKKKPSSVEESILNRIGK